MLASVAGLTLAWAFVGDWFEYGAVYGALTGLGLLWILRTPPEGPRRFETGANRLF